MICRDPRTSEDILNQELTQCEKEIQQSLIIIDDPDSTTSTITSNLYHFYFNNFYTILYTRYARADKYIDLSQYYPDVLDALEVANNKTSELLADYGGYHIWALQIDNIDKYKVTLGLMFFTLTLKVKDSAINQLISLIPSGDLLLDKIISQYDKNRVIGKKLLYPREFRQLIDIIEAPTDKQMPLVKKYLVKWKKKLDNYKPYWCFEVAVIMKAFNIDDTELQNEPHYPYELMHWNT